MRRLKQPRGPGTSWVLSMETPVGLIGMTNPWTGKPFAKTIRKGLGTRYLDEARRLRDIYIGQLRQMEYDASDASKFDTDMALDFRQELQDADAKDPTGKAADRLELAMSYSLEAAESRGQPRKKLRQFNRIASRSGYPFAKALPEYIAARSPDNSLGVKPLKTGTIKEVDTAAKHLKDFFGADAEMFCLEDITKEQAQAFRFTYLPSVISKYSGKPMSARTADKYITMLRPLWRWAIAAKLTASGYLDPWQFDLGLPRVRKTNEAKHDPYTAEEMRKLLAAAPRGTKGGDAIRLSIATGVRINELVLLTPADVESDGTGFVIPDAKTPNGKRYVPVVGEAHALFHARLDTNRASGRLFPEWPIYAKKGKSDAVSKWFVVFRRRVLGKETDGRLVLHSTRHTWRTVARRSGINDTDVRDLGGWAGPRTSDTIYDHGLLRTQLIAAQQRIWDALIDGGYLEGW